ncbi:MAG: hypothetical protein ABI550_06360 [Ignavibacteriaceae bacterium]
MSLNEINRVNKVRNYLRDLRALVRRQPLHEWLAFLSSLNFSNNKTWKIFQERTKNDDKSRKAYRIFLPVLAKYSILNSNDNIGISNRNFEEVYRDVRKCIEIIIEVKDWIPPGLFDNPEIALAAWTFLMANQQNIFQEFPKNTFARCFWLYDRIPKELKAEKGINMEKDIENIYGLSLNKLWIITSNIIGQYQGGYQIFDSNNDTIDKDSIKYFDKFSIEYKDFRTLATDKTKSLIGESTQFYGFSPFDLFPIIRTQGKYIIVCPYYLIRRFYIPMYFDLLNHYQKSKDKKENLFSYYFGEVFQFYVGKQLTLLDDNDGLLYEFDYDKDGSKKFCDFTLIYDDCAILIEVKKYLIPVHSKFELNRSNLKDALSKSLVLGLIQIANKIEHIKSNIIGLEKFNDIKNFYPLVITFDDSYQMNDLYIRILINEILNENGIQFDNKWQIMTIRELENIVSICSKKLSFITLMKKKVEGEKVVLDFDTFLISEKIEILDNELINQVIKEEINSFNEGKSNI